MTAWAVASGDFTPLGGMDRANHALARYLATSGREVHLVAHRVWPDLSSLAHVTVHHAARPLGSHLLGGPLLARKAATVARRIGSAARYLSNGGNTTWDSPTWIHYLHAAHTPAAAGHRSRLTSAAGRRRFLADEARSIAGAAVVICNSERTAEDVRRHYGVPASRVRVVYYGVDAEQFGPVRADARQASRQRIGIGDDRRLAVFVGALGDRRKGFDLVFDAWKALCRDRSWDVDLAVVGAGSEAHEWQARAGAAQLGSRITFLGFRGDVSDVLGAADVIVHPSRYEAYGLSVHEALCRGVTAIVSDSAGVAERLPDDLRALTLPSPGTAAALAERLRLWRSDETTWRQRTESFAGKLRARSWDDMSRDIAALVEHA